MRLLLRRLARCAAVLAIATSSARAQLTAGAAPKSPAQRAALADSASAVARAIVVPTEPSSIRIVAIPVPPEMRGHAGRFEFVRQSLLTVNGRLEGDIAADDSARLLVVNVSVPASAAAGRMTVGAMKFSCSDGCETITIPVILDVQARSSLVVESTRPLIGSSPGSRASAEIVVRNTGNAPERITLILQLPNDWRSRVPTPLPFKLDAGATSVIHADIFVSGDAGLGDYGVVIQASATGGGTALGAVTVRVSAGQHGPLAWRPIFAANLGVSRDDAGNVARAYGGELNGEVFPNVRASGQASVMPEIDRLSGLTQRSLGRLGYATNNSFLTLTAPTWEAGVGMLGLSNTGLVGTGLWGGGASGRVTTNAWRGSVFDVSPMLGGNFFVADAARRVGPSWTGLVGSSLRDDGGIGRSARTFAGTFEIPSQNGGVLLQAGRRESDSVAGFGWLAQVQRRAPNWSYNALISHSPGGLKSFARAEDEVQLDGFRKVNSVLSLGGGYWRTRDGPALVKSDGWSVAPQLSLRRFGSVTLDGRSYRSDGSTDVGAFGSVDRELRATWYGGFSRVQTRFGVARGTLERTSRIVEMNSDARATRTSMFGAVTVSSRYGSLQVDGTRERAGAGVGLPSHQTSGAVHLDQVPLWPRHAYLRAEVYGYYLDASRSTSLSQVAGIDVQLGTLYRVSLDAERNNFQLSPTGKTPWVISTKIRRSIGVPAFRRAGMGGTVFADLNGNGTRERNERGVSGVVIEVDGDMVTSDANGRFSIARERASHVQVDPRSLAAGWIAGPRPIVAPAASVVELSVLPTSPVEVNVNLSTTQGLDTTNVHFEKAIVVLTDSAGRRWYGAANARGTMRFDALPPGTYEVSADLSHVGETVTLPAELPTVRVEGAGPTQRVTLTVSPRRIRLVPPSRQSTNGEPSGIGSADAP